MLPLFGRVFRALPGPFGPIQVDGRRAARRRPTLAQLGHIAGGRIAGVRQRREHQRQQLLENVTRLGLAEPEL